MSLQQVYRRCRYGRPIVVVSGLPRSGTSMAMRMLAAGGMQLVVDGVRTADEDNPAGYFEAERVKDLGRHTDHNWLRAARGQAVKIVSSLLEHLPDHNNYAVVFMNRNLQEVLASQAKMLARRGEDSQTSDERLLEMFAAHLVRVKAMLRSRSHFSLCEIEYKDVVADPLVHARRIRAFLNQPLDVDAMAQAVDPRLHRNRV